MAWRNPHNDRKLHFKRLGISVVFKHVNRYEFIMQYFHDSLSNKEMTINEDIPKEVLSSTALTSQDWHKAPQADRDIRFISEVTEKRQKHSSLNAERNGVDRMGTLLLKQNGILFRKHNQNGEEFSQIALPSNLIETLFSASYDDLGHQERDRTTSLIKQRLFWPRMAKYIKERSQNCSSCIRRKKTPGKAALVNITSTTQMELVCIDYLSLERSKRGFENILVITDHLSCYAQAIPTRNETATTTAKALYENFFLHYQFPAKLHSDKGANSESKVIKKL